MASTHGIAKSCINDALWQYRSQASKNDVLVFYHQHVIMYVHKCLQPMRLCLSHQCMMHADYS